MLKITSILYNAMKTKENTDGEQNHDENSKFKFDLGSKVSVKWLIQFHHEAEFSRWVIIIIIHHFCCIFGCVVADSWFKGGTSAGIWNYSEGSSSVWPAGSRRGPEREQDGCDSPTAGDHWDRESSESGCQRRHGKTQILTSTGKRRFRRSGFLWYNCFSAVFLNLFDFHCQTQYRSSNVLK